MTLKNFFILHHTFIKIFPIAENIKNAIISAATIVDPTGVPAKIEIIIPIVEHITEKITEHIVTVLKLLKILIADNAGNITSADINNEPANFIARTITTAVTTAINKL